MVVYVVHIMVVTVVVIYGHYDTNSGHYDWVIDIRKPWWNICGGYRSSLIDLRGFIGGFFAMTGRDRARSNDHVIWNCDT